MSSIGKVGADTTPHHRAATTREGRACDTPSTDEAGQRRLTFVDILPSEELWEYQVLVTSLVEQVGSFGQLYRDRADGETIFDELKNQ